MHNLVYFVKLYIFQEYLGPSSGGTTLCIQQLVIILFIWLSVVLFNPTRTTDGHLKRTISTKCLYIRLYLLMIGLETPETCRGWRNILRISCATSRFFFTRLYHTTLIQSLLTYRFKVHFNLIIRTTAWSYRCPLAVTCPNLNLHPLSSVTCLVHTSQNLCSFLVILLLFDTIRQTLCKKNPHLLVPKSLSRICFFSRMYTQWKLRCLIVDKNLLQ
jgi:hypothetical protein